MAHIYIYTRCAYGPQRVPRRRTPSHLGRTPEMQNSNVKKWVAAVATAVAASVATAMAMAMDMATIAFRIFGRLQAGHEE